MTIVTTQSELDAAIAAGDTDIRIYSPADTWLVVTGDACVWVCDNARVRAYDNANVSARDFAQVWAYGDTCVWACGNARVEAFDNAHVTACDTAQVKACGSAHVTSYGSAQVSAGRYVAVHRHSDSATITGGTVLDMTTVDKSDPHTWCDLYGVQVDDDGVAYLYKAVNDHYTTDRGVDYSPGTLPHADDWQPTNECGHGLHFGATPALSAVYYPQATRYVRVGVRAADLIPLDDKVKAPRVVVPCVEVDAWGDPIEQKETDERPRNSGSEASPRHVGERHLERFPSLHSRSRRP